MKGDVFIECCLKNGLTVLQKSYATPPFKIANITEDKKRSLLSLMLMSSSPGVLDGDEYSIKIKVGEGCSLKLETQSYQRLFKMAGGASQCFEIKVERDASFIYIPHPVVPHSTSTFIAKNKLYLSEGSILCWGEVLTSGRKLHGETFLFTKYQSITEIYKDGKLLVRENLLLQPQLTNVQGLGQLEDFTHQATLLYINDTLPPQWTACIMPFLEKEERIEFGYTQLPVKGMLLRILGFSGEQLFNCLKVISASLEKRLDYAVVTS